MAPRRRLRSLTPYAVSHEVDPEATSEARWRLERSRRRWITLASSFAALSIGLVVVVARTRPDPAPVVVAQPRAAAAPERPVELPQVTVEIGSAVPTPSAATSAAKAAGTKPMPPSDPSGLGAPSAASVAASATAPKVVRPPESQAPAHEGVTDPGL